MGFLLIFDHKRTGGMCSVDFAEWARRFLLWKQKGTCVAQGKESGGWGWGGGE